MAIEFESNNGYFEPLKDYVFILADKNSTSEYTLASGLIFKKFPEYEKYHHDFAVQSGIVKHLPSKTSCGNMELQVGDFVYCHHYLTDDENEIIMDGVPMYSMNYDNVYCAIRDEKIFMLKGWNFLMPENNETKTKGGLFWKPETKYNEKYAYMAHPSELSKELGIEDGMKVHFKKGAHYKMWVQGELYYRIHDEHLIAIE